MLDLSWDNALQRDDLIGGDFEFKTPLNEGTLRGPIRHINKKSGIITIEMKWVARLKLSNKPTWSRWDKKDIDFHEEFAPLRDTENGSLFCLMKKSLGTFTIFLKGTGNLNPAKVIGLTAEELR